LIVYRELVEETQSQHRMILEAIVRRDTEAVAAAVETHIQATRVGLHHLLFDAPVK
jgi:DNA-binding GntR family transcriptional regulator